MKQQNKGLNHHEIKELEVKLAKAFDLDKVSLVRSEDYKKEDKVIELPTQASKTEESLTKAGNFLDDTLDKFEGSKVYRFFSKTVESTLDFLFPESKVTEYEIEGSYDHHKLDAEKDGNVVYLSRDFKDKK